MPFSITLVLHLAHDNLKKFDVSILSFGLAVFCRKRKKKRESFSQKNLDFIFSATSSGPQIVFMSF